MSTSPKEPERPANAAATPDELHADPANWKWGIFYFSREDRRIVVPKRIRGLGWTINFARPEAILWAAGAGEARRGQPGHAPHDQAVAGRRHYCVLPPRRRRVAKRLIPVPDALSCRQVP
jgi:hypothetical protein